MFSLFCDEIQNWFSFLGGWFLFLEGFLFLGGFLFWGEFSPPPVGGLRIVDC